MENELRPRRGILVRVTGHTDLHNFYPESWRKADRNRVPRRTSSTCTVKRTRILAKRIAEVHALIARVLQQRVYLITLTTSPDWIGRVRKVGKPSHSVDRRRRVAFASFLDRLRKEEGYQGHFWTTEVHEGERGKGANLGTIHHHVVVRFSGYWNYKSKVQHWSRRYCGSPNGLDVSNPRTGPGAYKYLYSAWHYLDLAADAELPFRWWGTSKVARKWYQHPDETILLPIIIHGNPSYKARCAKVPKRQALTGSARVTMDFETQRNKTTRLIAAMKRKQRKRFRQYMAQDRALGRRCNVRERAFLRCGYFR